MEASVKEFARIRKRKRLAHKDVTTVIDSMLKTLRSARADCSTAMDTTADAGAAATPPPPGTVLQVTAMLSELADGVQSIKKHHKGVSSSLSKYGKQLDKVFETNLTKISHAEAFKGSEDYLNHTVAEHFLRQGRWSLGEQFMQGTGLALESGRTVQFKETTGILEALKKRDLAPALAWAHLNRAYLESAGSRLEFLLHRLAFIVMITQGKRFEAIAYAKQHLECFSATELPEIRKLLGALVYIKRLAQSRYGHLQDDSHWVEVADLCARECARHMGLSKESPLEVCVNAGCIAIPKLLKVQTVLYLSNANKDIKDADELPVEIDLGPDRLYHSVFTCPVSRETACATNPPMRLPCGHVICQDSIRKIAKGNRRRFKCTYCPSEQTPVDVQKLHF